MYVDDLARLRHMLLAAEEAQGFATNRLRDDLDTDRMLVLALLKSIEIIGEAASRISYQFCDAHPEIPWQGIIAMRNRLVHGYFDIDLDRVWDTVVDDLPRLNQSLRTLIAHGSS